MISIDRDSIFRYTDILTDPFETRDVTEIDDELTNLGNSEQDIDRAAVREQLERTRYRVAPRASFTLNSRTLANVGYEYYEVAYQDESLADQLGAQDITNHRLSAGIRRAVDELTRLEFNVAATKYDPDKSEEADAYQVNVILYRRLTERTELDVSLGANRVSPDGDSGSDEDGFSGSVSITHNTLSGRLRGAIRRDIYPSSFGEIVEADSVNVNYRRRFSPRFAASLDVRGASTDSTSGNGRQERDYIQISPEMHWAVSENWQVSMGYQYRWSDREIDRDDASSNSVFLSFRYQPRSEIQ